MVFISVHRYVEFHRYAVADGKIGKVEARLRVVCGLSYAVDLYAARREGRPRGKRTNLQCGIQACKRADRALRAGSVLVGRLAQPERVARKNDSAFFNVGIALNKRHNNLLEKILHIRPCLARG